MVLDFVVCAEMEIGRLERAWEFGDLDLELCLTSLQICYGRRAHGK